MPGGKSPLPLEFRRYSFSNEEAQDNPETDQLVARVLSWKFRYLSDNPKAAVLRGSPEGERFHLRKQIFEIMTSPSN